MRVCNRNDPETEIALPTLQFLKEPIEQEQSAQIRNKTLGQKETLEQETGLTRQEAQRKRAEVRAV